MKLIVEINGDQLNRTIVDDFYPITFVNHGIFIKCKKHRIDTVPTCFTKKVVIARLKQLVYVIE